MNKLTLISRIRTAADRCLSRLVRLRREPIAHREAVRLAQVMWRRSYLDAAPHWQPLDDTAGVISQIDNMHAGVVEQNERMRRALHHAALFLSGKGYAAKEADERASLTKEIQAALANTSVTNSHTEKL